MKLKTNKKKLEELVQGGPLDGLRFAHAQVCSETALIRPVLNSQEFK